MAGAYRKASQRSASVPRQVAALHTKEHIQVYLRENARRRLTSRKITLPHLPTNARPRSCHASLSTEDPKQDTLLMSGAKSNKKRMRMMPWLVERLDAEDTPGAKWVERTEGLFSISWVHASRNTYDASKDSMIFEKYAQHTGKENSGDHKRYKANFRCALNSIKCQVEEIKAKSSRRGSDAVRVFRFIGWEGSSTKEELDFVRKTPSPDSTSSGSPYMDTTDHSLTEPSTSTAESDSFYEAVEMQNTETDSGGQSDSGSETCLDDESEDMVLEGVLDMGSYQAIPRGMLASWTDPMLPALKSDPIENVEKALQLEISQQQTTILPTSPVELSCSYIDRTIDIGEL